MKILTNYYVHSFLLALIIVSLFLIAYLNFNAYHTALQNQVVNVLKNPGACNYDNIPIITESGSDGFFIKEAGLEFTLATVEKNYIDVCKTLCTTFKNSICEGKESLVSNYNLCIKLLETNAGCAGLEKPLGYRLNSTDGSKVNFYAKSVKIVN